MSQIETLLRGGGVNVSDATKALGAAHDNVTRAVGQQGEGVRSLQMEAVLWEAVEQELRAMLNGLSGANLIRRLRIDLIAAQAYTIGSQLARDPTNAILLPQVEEIKRLKRARRRKKAAPAHETTDPQMTQM